MRICIPRGKKYIEALEDIMYYFENNFNDYPYIRTDMYIYFSLKAADGKVCPLNDMDYLFDGEKMIDRTEERINKAKEKLLIEVLSTLDEPEEMIKDAEERIKSYKKYLRQAKQRGYSTAEKWRERIEILEDKINVEYAKSVKNAERVRNCLKQGLTHFHIHTDTDNYNKIKTIRILLEIDSECQFFNAPLYYAAGEYSHSKPDYDLWLKA